MQFLDYILRLTMYRAQNVAIRSENEVNPDSYHFYY